MTKISSALLFALCLFGFQAFGEKPATITVSLAVNGDETELANEITSYLSRELHEIPDVRSVSGNDADFRVTVFPQRLLLATGADTGWVMVVLVEVPTSCGQKYPTERKVRAMYLRQGPHSDLKQSCQQIVADLDTVYLGSARKQKSE